jgi:HAE1 family hydrophobic/amphiphilic exporter-1
VKTLQDYESTIFNRINPAVRFSVTRYVLSIGLFLAVVVFGLVSTLNLGVDLLPAVTIPVVVVTTPFPGASPSVIDQQVTQVIENAVSTLSGITEIDASSSIGLSRVIIRLDPSTNKTADMTQVASLVSAAVRSLPQGAQPPNVSTFDPNAAPILQFGLSGEGAASLADVSDYVQNTLTPMLERVPGVANVTTDGGPSDQFQVLLNPDRLGAYNLTPQQVVSAISSAAVSEPIGTITSQNSTLSFTTQNIPSDVAGIAQILVDSQRGITVAQLGTVRESSVASDYARVNGQPVVLVSIHGTSDSNAVAVVQGVRRLLAQTPLPAGYRVEISNDTTGPIQASVRATYRELLLTGLVVALVVLLFVGKLNTVISVILAIPIALSAAPVLYRLAGFTFNLVSLLALIVAVGIVVDDSIVVAENVERYRAMGLSLKESVLKGASEVFSAVVAASLSLISVLLPVSFIGGFVGRYLQQFSLGLAAAVAFSLLEAVLFLTVRMAYTPETGEQGWRGFLKSFLLLPDAFRWGLRAWRRLAGLIVGVLAMAALVLTRHYLLLPLMLVYPIALGLLYYLGRILLRFLDALTATLHGWTEAALEWVRGAYTRSLGGILKHGVWVLAGAGAFLVFSAALIAPRIPFNFVPQTDSGTMGVDLRLPPGTPQELANVDAGRIESYLLARPEVRTVQTIVGTGAEMVVQLVPLNERPSVFELLPLYRRQMQGLLRDQPSARLGVSAGGGFRNEGTTVFFNLVAADFNTLLERNGRILQELQNNPYVADVFSSLSTTTLEGDFVPNPSALQGTGISAGTVAGALETYTSGTQAANVISGGLSYPIQVQLDPAYLASGQSLLNLPVYSPALQANLHVGQLGSFTLQEAPVSISRYNRLYTGQLSIDLKPNAPTALSMQNQITEELTKAGLLGGGVGLISSSFGQAALAGQLASTGPVIFLFGLFLAYLVMAAQFNSWRYPIYLLLPVPLALVGALWLVFLLGGGLDIFGLLGMLMLIGLSAKNAIIYLDFVSKRLGRMPFQEALIDSARLRFRPIVMTTMTILVISIPLVFSRGQGSEFGQRLGVVMFGGIVFSAVLTFFVVPAAFYLFERGRPVRLEQQQADAGDPQEKK